MSDITKGSRDDKSDTKKNDVENAKGDKNEVQETKVGEETKDNKVDGAEKDTYMQELDAVFDKVFGSLGCNKNQPSLSSSSDRSKPY